MLKASVVHDVSAKRLPQYMRCSEAGVATESPVHRQGIMLTIDLVAQCCWSATTKVGMGKGTADGGATYIVARYTPPGNMAGQKPF